ncbi:alpha/beta fold hydrolase, partial [Nocardia sp. NPDC059091]|uniref:alpha/beta fold hydrolase n=1 Tax=unclassified Nocardia TaxID=2637762 RepID=UPI0036C579A9
LGLPALSLAWGLWAQSSGMTGHLHDTDIARMAKLGLRAMSTEQALALFDASVALGISCSVPIRIDRTALQGISALSVTPPALRNLAPNRPATGSPESTSQLRERIAALGDDEKFDALLEIVRRNAAAVLGHATAEAIQPDRQFLEQGFESLSVLELANKLHASLGLRITPMVILDSESPADLATHLLSELAKIEQSEPNRTNGNAASDTFSEIFHQAVKNGRIEEGLKLLDAATALRPKFDTLDGSRLPGPVRLADGDRDGIARIVCVVAPTATGGAHQYARLAARFRGKRSVSAVSLPGFRVGESLPATPEIAVEMVADSILKAAGDGPFVILGHSSGGNYAHAATHYLNQTVGRTANGLIMLDSFRPATIGWGVPMDQLMLALIDREGILGRFDTTKLTAMVHWCSMLHDIERPQTGIPELFVKCNEPYFFNNDGESKIPWLAEPWFPTQQVEQTETGHFSLLEEEVDSTAMLVESWIRAITI